MTNEEVEVTIVCKTYNHELYVAQALDSFLMQKTEFAYKILVHDDCSTDGTPTILKQYQEKYPQLIEVIQQETNLYSQGINLDTFIKPRLEGPYVAVCEGDDYWLSEDKLQIQYNYMRANPNCSLCVHASKQLHDRFNAFVGFQRPSMVERDYSTEDVIAGGGGLFPTNSMFFRSEYYCMPIEYLDWGVGDYPRTIFLSTRGDVHYSPEIMSVYRVFAKGSWSSRQSADKNLENEGYKQRIDGLRKFDYATDGAYHETVECAVGERERCILANNGDWETIRKHPNRYQLNRLSKLGKAKLYLKCNYPTLFKILKTAFAVIKTSGFSLNKKNE